MFLMFKFTSLSFNQMGPTIPLTRGTRPAGSASQAMEECWEDLHLTCHSLETTATCTHTTAWWESVGSDQYILPCSITYIKLKKFLFLLSVSELPATLVSPTDISASLPPMSSFHRGKCQHLTLRHRISHPASQHRRGSYGYVVCAHHICSVVLDLLVILRPTHNLCIWKTSFYRVIMER